MTTVYVDSVFLLNAIMDYLLCLVTARLAGIPLRRKRYLLAALAGGAYAVMVFLPECAFLSAAPVKIAAGILLALIAYGGEEHLLRLSLLFFGVSCAMAGSVLALGAFLENPVPSIRGILYTDVNGTVLAVAAGGVSLTLMLVFRAAAHQGIDGRLLPVRISIGGKVWGMTALWDSGNALRDPVGGRPVLIASAEPLRESFPGTVRTLLTEERLRSPAEVLEPLRRAAPELCPRLLPYHAVGVRSGMLLTLRSDWIEICGERYERALVALAPAALGTGYAALWGGNVKKGGIYGNAGKNPSMAPQTAGADACGSLHRRQRHSSAAADKGT